VVNLSKNHFRRRAVERRFLARAAEPEPVPGPEGASIDRHTIVHALGRLPQRQRAAIVLRYYEDLPRTRSRLSSGAVQQPSDHS
jgi:DNA-directed RNA polymerase specialized sigma24 family protein